MSLTTNDSPMQIPQSKSSTMVKPKSLSGSTSLTQTNDMIPVTATITDITGN
jgi:hypothetical protein